MILLQAGRLIPRNYAMDDVPAVQACFSDEEVSRYGDFRPQTVNEAAEGLPEWKDMDNRMAAVLKETGELIGSAGYRGAGQPVFGHMEQSRYFPLRQICV